MTTVAQLEVSELTSHPAWLRLKSTAAELQPLQAANGSVENPDDHQRARALVEQLVADVAELAPLFAHDAAYLDAVQQDFRRWVDGGFAVPDFYDSLMLFQPQLHRVDGLTHLVVFPMYTQNGSRSRLVEVVLVQVIWPDHVAELESGDYSNKLFVPIR